MPTGGPLPLPDDFGGVPLFLPFELGAGAAGMDADAGGGGVTLSGRRGGMLGGDGDSGAEFAAGG